MNDDLRAAIERYKKHLAVDWSDSASIATSPYCDIKSKRFSVVEIQADESVIIDAYLADLAERERREAERALPIDGLWLIDIGFGFHSPDEKIRGRETYFLYKGLIEVSWKANVNRVELEVDGEVVVLREITTRGQLLDLLAALGVKGGG